MAVLSEKQTEVVKLLEDARVIYEEFEEQLAIEVADRKWDAKQDIRRLVREARDVGIPYRQIGFAIKTSDHRTIQAYEQDVRK